MRSIAKNSSDYQQGELIGKAGIEKEYEVHLRGTKGKKYSLRNRFNKVTGPYRDGALDSLPCKWTGLDPDHRHRIATICRTVNERQTWWNCGN